jgi:prefoldin subunit 4
MPLPQAIKRIERDQKGVDDRFGKVAGEVEEIESQMRALKVVLYAKFGKAINLEE